MGNKQSADQCVCEVCEVCPALPPPAPGEQLTLQFLAKTLLLPLVLAIPLHFFLNLKAWSRVRALAYYVAFQLLTWLFVIVRLSLIIFRRPLAMLWERRWRKRVRLDTTAWGSEGQGPLSTAELVALVDKLDTWAMCKGPGSSAKAATPIAFSFSGCSWLM
jgi:hypothetical protein